MTTVKFYKQNNNFVKLKATGHTCYAEQGKDIICASISSVLGSLALGLKQVLNINITHIENKENASLTIELPSLLSDDQIQKSNLLFLVALATIEDFKSGYSKYIKLEVIE